MITVSKMHDRIREGRPAIGCVTLTTGPEWIDTIGAAGLDLVCIDMMVTAIDWAEAANMVRAANQFGMTSWIRLQGYPWSGGGEAETRTVADVLRAICIGAEGVTISVDTPAQVEAILHPAEDAHRRVWMAGNEWLRPDVDGFPRAEREPDPIEVFPLIESRTGADNIAAILDVPGLRAVFLGMGDLSKELGHPADNDHAEVRAFVEHTVRLARERNVRVMANTGYHSAPGRITEAVSWLWQAGVQVIWIPYPSYLVYTAYRDTLRQIRSEVA